jgi:hypothetical protein
VGDLLEITENLFDGNPMVCPGTLHELAHFATTNTMSGLVKERY